MTLWIRIELNCWIRIRIRIESIRIHNPDKTDKNISGHRRIGSGYICSRYLCLLVRVRSVGIVSGKQQQQDCPSFSPTDPTGT
jgi:hypothetical protein